MSMFRLTLAARLRGKAEESADVLIERIRTAKIKRVELERQSEEAFSRYKELKEAEFEACREIAEAKTALMSKTND